MISNFAVVILEHGLLIWNHDEPWAPQDELSY